VAVMWIVGCGEVLGWCWCRAVCGRCAGGGRWCMYQ